MFRLFYILENCISKYIKKGQMQRGIAAENCGYAFFHFTFSAKYK